MEKFFKPVHCPSGPEEIKLRKHPHHHHHHHEDPQSHRYKLFDDTDRTESNWEHRHNQRGHYVHENPHSDTHRQHPAQSFHPIEDNEILYNHDTPVTLFRASSSSLSSSSSSFSSSSWYTETSANDPFSLRHAERPQHSLSCSNIPDLRRGLRDDSSGPIVVATIKHGSKGNVCSQLDGSTQRNVKCDFSTLDRGHSRSEEGLLQSNEDESGKGQFRVKNYRPLYKSSSLSRSLAFSEEDIQLGVSRGPKRAVSSIQLPSKGILKNREPHSDIRKAKSMEVLSPRVAKGQECSGPKGKELNQANIERARADFLQGKLQFSAFLDDITKQVMSPSYLSVLGMNRNKTPIKASTLTSDPIKPQLPPKKHREGSGSGEQKAKQRSAQEKTARKSSDCSNPDKLISYAARKHQGSPLPHQCPNSTGHSTHHGRGRKDKRPSPLGGPVSGDRHGRCGSQLTDGTSTSPEPTQPKQRLHHKQTTAFSIPRAHSQQFSQPLPEVVHPNPRQQGPSPSAPSTAQGDGVGPGSESSSSKSDSSRSRDTPSTATSHSSEKSGRHHTHLENSKQHRNTPFDADHLQALQEENSDLHQNLLQTVVCIESLESELQRTREELSTVKEKYKSLLETHGGSKPVNNLLGDHLHIASESLGGDKKYLLNRVSQLSSELEDARRTISSLENINVPSLIKELLEKHFGSAETVQRFLTVSAPISHCASSPPAVNQPHNSKVVQEANDWLTKTEAAPQMVTAFVPSKQGIPLTGTEGSVSSQHKASYSPPFSVADISTAIYNKIAANYAARPPYSQSQQQPTLTTKYADSTLIPKQAHGADSLGGKSEVKVTLLGEDVVGVTSMTAQQILDDFMQQLQAHKEGGGGNEQQGGQEWAGGMEQTGRVMD